MLRIRKLDLSLAYHVMQTAFQRILCLSVPLRGIWLRPEVADIINTSKLRIDQIIHLEYFLCRSARMPYS